MKDKIKKICRSCKNRLVHWFPEDPLPAPTSCLNALYNLESRKTRWSRVKDLNCTKV